MRLGFKTGNIYTEANLNPDNYPRFLQADETLLVLAVVLSAIYLLFCFINIRQSPPKEEKAGKSAPM